MRKLASMEQAVELGFQNSLYKYETRVTSEVFSVNRLDDLDEGEPARP